MTASLFSGSRGRDAHPSPGETSGPGRTHSRLLTHLSADLARFHAALSLRTRLTMEVCRAPGGPRWQESWPGPAGLSQITMAVCLRDPSRLGSHVIFLGEAVALQ